MLRIRNTIFPPQSEFTKEGFLESTDTRQCWCRACQIRCQRRNLRLSCPPSSRANLTQSKLSVLTVRASGIEFELFFTSKIESSRRSPRPVQAGHGISRPKETSAFSTGCSRLRRPEFHLWTGGAEGRSAGLHWLNNNLRAKRVLGFSLASTDHG